MNDWLSGGTKRTVKGENVAVIAAVQAVERCQWASEKRDSGAKAHSGMVELDVRAEARTLRKTMFSATSELLGNVAGLGGMTRVARLFSACCGFVLLAAGAWGQQHYRVDPASSEVHFTLGASDGPVKGTFHVTSGEFTLDPSTGAMTGTVAVDALTGESGNKSRDKKMTNTQLKAQTYPTVAFAPTKFSGQLNGSGDSTGQVEGNFTLIGQAHPITVPMTVHVEGDHFSASGVFVVPYVNWGVKDPSWFVMKVDKEVKVELKLVGAVTK